MSFNYEGYLSEQVKQIEIEIHQKNQTFFSLYEDYNKFAHRLKFKLNIHSHNVQEIAVSGLYILTLNSFNSIYILAKKGLVNDCKSLTRALVEKLINLKFCALHYDNSIQYVNQNEFRRLKFLNIIKDNKFKGLNDEITESIDFFDEISKMKAHIAKKDIKEIPTVEELANMVGYPDLYSYVYRIFSDEIHANSKVIEKFFSLNEDEEIETLKWYPDLENIHDDVRLVLITCMDMLDRVLNIVFELFDIEDGLDESSKEYVQLRQSLEELSTKD
ncbi:DUF5677 domain-containing protein [Tenuibacillus multivorans]|uniref:Uncharacterized protein n=1 Tax=Tenuibacillus multivorans TaxID=237069 RepID=A0A1G9YNW9_9BACI|nr:DUF5677 domain-containing protein [Tenuibacillus multivorans]GEL78467.1 hypothetical protein TMU01_27020 [Tenuibacillus multivorans]SDN10173.1 hypothetical protein SAMN05216498_1472 [Tenuibacillus multivorans]